ncbi:MAG: amidohydrolase [bacterium]|nr:amidohydrolase [bacterium]
MNLIDRIVYNGHILTMNAAQPRVSALAISRGRIAAVGTDDQIVPLAGSATIRENLNGRLLIPGLTDAHIHFLGTTGLLHQVDLFDVPSKAEALARVAERAARTPPGEWIEGYGWWQERWAERQFPTRHDLDAVVPDKPVFLRARSGHAAWVNSFALHLCGITRDTPNPPGGEIGHDEGGEPNGLLLEWSAMGLVGEYIPPKTPEQIASQMAATQALLLSLGVTGIHDFDDPPCLRGLQVLRERGALNLRVVKQINKDYFPAALESGLRSGFGDDWIRFGALKMFADGALGPRTAAMIEPYEGEPDNYGIVVVEKEEMTEWALRASRAGFASTVHAIGDRAVHDVLDVFEAVRRDEAERGTARRARRHRIEHVQIIHPDDVDRLAALDIIASMQPIHATSDMLTADQFWGARAAYAYNPRLQMDRGVTVAFGSDSPYDILDPIKGIHAAVTRRRADGAPDPEGWYPAARVTLEEAIRAYTVGAAYAAGIEDRAGQLAPGYLADMVVLDQDWMALPPDHILQTRVLGTMVDGEWRFGSAAG